MRPGTDYFNLFLEYVFPYRKILKIDVLFSILGELRFNSSIAYFVCCASCFGLLSHVIYSDNWSMITDVLLVLVMSIFVIWQNGAIPIFKQYIKFPLYYSTNKKSNQKFKSLETIAFVLSLGYIILNVVMIFFLIWDTSDIQVISKVMQYFNIKNYMICYLIIRYLYAILSAGILMVPLNFYVYCNLILVSQLQLIANNFDENHEEDKYIETKLRISIIHFMGVLRLYRKFKELTSFYLMVLFFYGPSHTLVHLFTMDSSSLFVRCRIFIIVNIGCVILLQIILFGQFIQNQAYRLNLRFYNVSWFNWNQENKKMFWLFTLMMQQPLNVGFLGRVIGFQYVKEYTSACWSMLSIYLQMHFPNKA